jgi:hypothetical protein
VQVGLHHRQVRASISVPRAEALALIERLYRAVAPRGYVECPV